MRIAAAPISWGVCEVPGWGHQLEPDYVLRQMVGLGITATEFGPQGWLPIEPAERARAIGAFGLTAVGAFIPLVLHRPSYDPVPDVLRELDSFRAAGGDVLVIAADSGLHGYDSRPSLDPSGWERLADNLDRVTRAVTDRGIRAALHPHVGTMIESSDEVAWVMEHSATPLCLDTGHLLIGGTDPSDLTTRYSSRIEHVHAKDVRIDLARRVQAGSLTYTEAVRQGMYVPLGEGDVDFPSILTSLDAAGYSGWYVIEQDTILESPHSAPLLQRDVKTSIEFLQDFRR